MAQKDDKLNYLEGMLKYLSDNTRGLEAEFNALFQALRVKKVHWVTKSKEQKKAEEKAKKEEKEVKKEIRKEIRREGIKVQGLPEHKVNVKL
jgi:hypothetical protein